MNNINMQIFNFLTNDNQDILNNGVTLINQLWYNNNHYKTLLQKKVENDIFIGQILIRLRDELHSKRQKWLAWRKINLPYLKERYCQKIMSLAKRKDCHTYAFLGQTRLLNLISITKDIPSFIKQNKLSQYKGDELTEHIDTFIKQPSSQKQFIKFRLERTIHDLKLIKNMKNNQEFVELLTKIRRSTGDVLVHLNKQE